MQKFQQLADKLKALGHPTRIALVKAIGENEVCASDLTPITGEQSLTSHHLDKLKIAGIINSRREGKYIMYSLNLNSVLVKGIYNEICLN